MYTYINNKIVSHPEAVIHVDDLSVQRGYGVFDFFKIARGHAFFLSDYLDRFYHSAEVLRLRVPLDKESLVQTIYELIRRNKMDESGMKLILTGGYSPDGYQPAEQPNFIITQQKLVLPSPEIVDRGVKVISHEFVRDVPEAKTLNYTMGIWLLEKIRARNAADVLYVKENVASEFPRCNFFIVRDDDSVRTPAANVLKGITRKNLLSLRGEFDIQEGVVTLDDTYNAREAFLTSTTKRIIPIVKINDRLVGDGRPGKVTARLLRKLIALETQDERAKVDTKR